MIGTTRVKVMSSVNLAGKSIAIAMLIAWPRRYNGFSGTTGDGDGGSDDSLGLVGRWSATDDHDRRHTSA